MIFVPISLGELVDKITILNIKKQKINDVDKLSNVNKEHLLLVDILKQNNMDENHELYKELYLLNLEFWEYHDWQREKWRELENISDHLIDTELYHKSRIEHVLNDKRAEIKKRINTLYKSDIIEEKQF